MDDKQSYTSAINNIFDFPNHNIWVAWLIQFMQFLKNYMPIFLFLAIYIFIFGNPFIYILEPDEEPSKDYALTMELFDSSLNDYELLKKITIIERNADYKWLRNDLSKKTFSDVEVKEIADCIHMESLDFLDAFKDKYQEQVPRINNENGKLKYLEELFKRPIINQDGYGQYVWKFTTRCMSRVKIDSIFENTSS